MPRTRSRRTGRRMALVLATLVAAPLAAAAGPAWVLLDPEGDIAATGLAKDGADIRQLTLHRTTGGTVEVGLTLASLDPPVPRDAAPQAVRHVLRFETAAWDVLVDVTVHAGGVSPANVLLRNEHALLWFDAATSVEGTTLRFDLGGSPFDGAWTRIRVESTAETCAGVCLAGGFRDRAPDTGIAPDFEE